MYLYVQLSTISVWHCVCEGLLATSLAHSFNKQIIHHVYKIYLDFKLTLLPLKLFSQVIMISLFYDCISLSLPRSLIYYKRSFNIIHWLLSVLLIVSQHILVVSFRFLTFIDDMYSNDNTDAINMHQDRPRKLGVNYWWQY